MYICFAEYKIHPEYRECYVKETERLMDKYSRKVQLYEGTDQPCLFVEVWHAESCEEAELIKKERSDERSAWHVVTPWIVGGSAKLHIWTFKPIR